MLRKMDEHAHGLSTGVGWVSLGIGLALTLAPNRSTRFLALEDRRGLASVVGASDLMIGTGLLVGQRRQPWMFARVFLNLVIAISYARTVMEDRPRRKRAGGGLCLMVALTVFDYTLARRLRRPKTS